MNLMKGLQELQQSIETMCKANGFFSYRVLWLGVVGVLLIAFSSVFNGDVLGREETELLGKKAAEQTPVERHAADVSNIYSEGMLETKLTRILSQVKGAGHVSVNVHFVGSERQEYAKNKVNETKTVQEKDTTGGVRTTTESKVSEQLLVGKETGSDRPIAVETVHPEIKGVIIVAEGAVNSMVKARLIKAVEAGLGIPNYKITVLPQ